MAENKKPDLLLRNTLLSILGLLKHKAMDKNLEPVISVSKVIDMLKIAGVVVTYDQLATLAKDPSIQPSIASINQNQLKLNLGDEPTQEPAAPMPEPPEEAPMENPEETMPEEEQGGDEDYLPPDGEEQYEEQPKPYKSTVSMMAKRAARRAD